MSLLEWEESYNHNLDESMLGELVELVGSEEEIEAAAKEAFEELLAAAESGDLDVAEDAVPEKLAVAALIVKLVELGKLGPEEADAFIEKNLEQSNGQERID